MSQASDIYDYLFSGKSLTRLEALKLFGCFELSARICEIEAMIDKRIPRRQIVTKKGKRVTEYYLEERA